MLSIAASRAKSRYRENSRRAFRSLGTRSLSAIPTEDFNEIYEIARENAGEIADGKISLLLVIPHWSRTD